MGTCETAVGCPRLAARHAPRRAHVIRPLSPERQATMNRWALWLTTAALIVFPFLYGLVALHRGEDADWDLMNYHFFDPFWVLAQPPARHDAGAVADLLQPPSRLPLLPCGPPPFRPDRRLRHRLRGGPVVSDLVFHRSRCSHVAVCWRSWRQVWASSPPGRSRKSEV